MDFMTAKEASVCWQISQRRIDKLCAENRIQGACLLGKMWILPKATSKPGDARHTHLLQLYGKLKPIIKWAGGKGQILAEIRRLYPQGIGTSIKKYAEPFIGGGAVLLDILGTYQMDEIFISDTNAELINLYTVIRDNCNRIDSHSTVL